MLLLLREWVNRRVMSATVPRGGHRAGCHRARGGGVLLPAARARGGGRDAQRRRGRRAHRRLSHHAHPREHQLVREGVEEEEQGNLGTSIRKKPDLPRARRRHAGFLRGSLFLSTFCGKKINKNVFFPSSSSSSFPRDMHSREIQHGARQSDRKKQRQSEKENEEEGEKALSLSDELRALRTHLTHSETTGDARVR